jgi:predicted anti-sigma-YlaC factor YlaD
MSTSGTHLGLIPWRGHDALREHAERHTVAGPSPVNTIGAKIRPTSGLPRIASNGRVRWSAAMIGRIGVRPLCT